MPPELTGESRSLSTEKRTSSRVLQEWWKLSSRPDFPCQNRVLARRKRHLANGSGMVGEGPRAGIGP